MIDASIIAYVVKYDALTELQGAGVTRDHFVDEYRTVWSYLLRTKRDHDTIPSADTLLTRFPDLELPRVRKRELPILLRDLRQRFKYISLLKLLHGVLDEATTFDDVDDVVQRMQGELNTLSFSGEHRNHLVDLFSAEVTEVLVEEVRRRRRGELAGIETGLKRFDRMTGGLMKQKMVVAIGRPGIGKSWLDLLFVASAVQAGYKFMLYPLEMTIHETAMRLYTLFSHTQLGEDRVFKNNDLTNGKVNTRKLVRFLNMMEDRFGGSLLVADVGSLSDPYTIERIEAEVELHQPDGFWVDYITLLKPPPVSNGQGDWTAVRMLSNGVKNIAMRRNCVGGASAQVSREAMRANVFLPRLEHIAYGDSIGQDADMVFSLNRRGKYLYYALVKNRGGPEIGRTRLHFGVNHGLLAETDNQEDDDDGDD